MPRSPKLTVLAVVVVAIAGASCTPDDTTVAPAPAVTGALCSMLPAGSEPGGPALLQHDTADVALQWIPVLTTFEAAVRATKFGAQLRRDPAVTILAPTDDAFSKALTEDTRDDLLLFRHRRLRAVLKAHIVRGSFSLDELARKGSVETLAGTTVTVSSQDGVVRIDDRADVVCGDYLAKGARIHVIGKILVDVPSSGSGDEDLG